MGSLDDLEELCKKLCETEDADELASSGLSEQVTENSNSWQLRFDIRNYLFEYLVTERQFPEIRLLCRVKKFGWFDDDRVKDVIKQAADLLSQAPKDHHEIGMKILNQLVSEMNQSNTGLPSTDHRTVACSFSDQSLFQIFQISLTSLKKLKDDSTSPLRKLALSLSLKCLSFDFVGTSIDESSEEFATIQIPSSWGPVLEDPSTLEIFFHYAITSPCSKEALECLVQLASVRGSLFTNDATRSNFLAHLMTGTKEILKAEGLDDDNNYHECCRLLGCFGVNYQLSELVNVEGYSDWIQLLEAFTSQSWQRANRSVWYLLRLWSRLVISVPSLKGEIPSMLDEYVPKITEGFITSRINSVQPRFIDDKDPLDDTDNEGFITSRVNYVQARFIEDEEPFDSSDDEDPLYNTDDKDPLDNVELLQDQLDCFSYLCRFQYQSSSLDIRRTMEPILQSYIRAGLEIADKKELALIEEKLSWIVHIVAAILKSKQSTSFSVGSQEVLDVGLSDCLFQLINVTDSGLHNQRYDELSKQRLGRAILTFFQAVLSSKLFARLPEVLGLSDQLSLLHMIFSKISRNLKCYTESEVINHTLRLFLELASWHVTRKQLMKLHSIKFLVANHTREHFPFLEEYRSSCSRTTFYHAVGWLIFMEESPVRFKSSMEPLLQVFKRLGSTPDSMFSTDDVKYALIGLTRDLRGIAMASNSRRTHELLFDWLYPAYLPVLLKGINSWTGKPEVTTPLLKFVAELVLNKDQRLTFDSSSTIGTLLFQEVSTLVVAYGQAILSPVIAGKYRKEYKGIWICLTIFSRALEWNDVYCGTSNLYGDRALSDALDIALKITLSIPLTDILAFRKLTRAYFSFLEVLFSSHIAVITDLDKKNFMHIVGALKSGLKGLDTNISSQCASAVDKLAVYYFSNVAMGEAPPSSAASNLARHIAECPDTFPEILKILFEIVLSVDCGNLRSLSRPMLSLTIISDKKIFSSLKAHILASQPMDQHQWLTVCFDKLIKDVTRSLDSKNRDKFTQNLMAFRSGNEENTRTSVAEIFGVDDSRRSGDGSKGTESIRFCR